MTSYHVTEDDDLVQNQGFRTDSDVDSDETDLSDEEDYSPEPEDLIQGPSELTGFVERGKQKADSAAAPAKDNKTPKKGENNIVLPPINQRKTDKQPPKKEPKAANYPHK